MNTGTWIAVFLPIFLLLFLFIPQAQAQQNAMRQIKYKVQSKKEAEFVANQLVAQCLEKNCLISTGFNGSYQGEVVEITDNWMKVDSKGIVHLINCDFVQSIRELPEKRKK